MREYGHHSRTLDAVQLLSRRYGNGESRELDEHGVRPAK
jgi:hypothetical protein